MFVDCKIRRRKCEKTSELDPCRLCHRLKKECIPYIEILWSDDSLETEDEMLTYDQFEVLYLQMRDLERQVHLLETEIAEEKALIKQPGPWYLEKTSNKLHLLSEIKSLEDLLQYAHYSIRYISPFGHLFDTPLAFQTTTTGAMNTVFKIVTHHFQKSIPAPHTHHFSTGFAQYIQPSVFVTQLVDSYFCCLQDFVPLLHEPSYRTHLETLENPLQDPITMAICTHASISTCRAHQVFYTEEKRPMAELYYELCMGQLVEIFDDPDRALEALMTIELIQSFMMLTLRHNEDYRWSGIASSLVAHLKILYPDYARGANCSDTRTRIQYALVHRSICRNERSTGVEQLINYAEGKEGPSVGYCPLDILPGESKRSCLLLEITNHWNRLYSLPQFNTLNQLLFNHWEGIQLIDLLQLEQMIVHWWHTLPAYLRLHTNPFSTTPCQVKACDEIPKLWMMMQVHLFGLGIQVQLLSPKLRGKENTNLPYYMIRNRALDLVKHSFHVILALIEKSKQVRHSCCGMEV